MEGGSKGVRRQEMKAHRPPSRSLEGVASAKPLLHMCGKRDVIAAIVERPRRRPHHPRVAWQAACASSGPNQPNRHRSSSSSRMHHRQSPVSSHTNSSSSPSFGQRKVVRALVPWVMSVSQLHTRTRSARGGDTPSTSHTNPPSSHIHNPTFIKKNIKT